MKRPQVAAFLVYQALFWVGILVPFDFRRPESLWDALFGPRDTDVNWVDMVSYLGHAVLFIPIGVLVERAVAARALGQAVGWSAFALFLAFASEGSQAFNSRQATVYDFLMDLAGAGIGGLLALRYRRSPRFRSIVRHAFSPAAMATFIFLIVSTFVLLALPRSTDFSSWDSSYPLLLGEEEGAERAWQGDLHEVLLLGRALSAAEVEQLASGLPEDVRSAVVHYRPGASGASGDGVAEAAVVRDLSANEPPLDLFLSPLASVRGLEGGGVRFAGAGGYRSRGPAARLTDALVQSEALTLMVRFEANDLTAAGPARLVTCSSGSLKRNFTLAQEGDGLHFRVRNQYAGENGVRPKLVAKGCVRPGRQQTVVAVAAATESRIYVDGKLAGRVNFSALSSLQVLIAGDLFQRGAWRGVASVGWLLGVLIFGVFFFPRLGRGPWLEVASLGASALLVGALYLVATVCRSGLF